MNGEQRLDAVLIGHLSGLGLSDTMIDGLRRSIQEDLRGGNPRCVVVQQLAMQRLEEAIIALRSQVTALGDEPCS